MIIELDKQLCEKYPKIFADRYKPMNQTCMCWGFDHGDGWYNIIDNMCAVIQNYINNSRNTRARALVFNRALKRALAGDKSSLLRYFSFKEKPADAYALKQVESSIAKGEYRPVPEACPQVVAAQVKEKFGTLCFYYRGGDSYIDGVVRMAECMSGTTCEDCGAPGISRQGGWIRTLCDEHAKERNYDENIDD